jgi:beta-galactosidase
VKALDSTRPVTAALANVAMSDAVGLPALLDVVGYNYQEQRYASDHQKFPARRIFGSENHHDYGAWLAVKTNAFVAGQFLWTGIDYLGEAGRWPNHASRAGLLDLCGFKKPMAWFRQSLWSEKPMVYLCVSGGQGYRGLTEQWNFSEGRTLTVLCYANCPEVTLELNGTEIGTKTSGQAVNGVLTWAVPYAPGTLKAIGRFGGKQLCEFALRTAGSAARIELIPDSRRLRADDEDICHVEFRIVDANGVRVPDADAEVKFQVMGPVRVLGIGNGDGNDIESTHDNVQRAFHGRGLMILQSTENPGDVSVWATAAGLESGEIKVRCIK